MLVARESLREPCESLDHCRGGAALVVFGSPPLYLLTAPKRTASGAAAQLCHGDVVKRPRGTRWTLLIRKEKELYSKVAKRHSQSESSARDTGEGKGARAVAPRTALCRPRPVGSARGGRDRRCLRGRETGRGRQVGGSPALRPSLHATSSRGPVSPLSTASTGARAGPHRRGGSPFPYRRTACCYNCSVSASGTVVSLALCLRHK